MGPIGQWHTGISLLSSPSVSAIRRPCGLPGGGGVATAPPRCLHLVDYASMTKEGDWEKICASFPFFVGLRGVFKGLRKNIGKGDLLEQFLSPHCPIWQFLGKEDCFSQIGVALIVCDGGSELPQAMSAGVVATGKGEHDAGGNDWCCPA